MSDRLSILSNEEIDSLYSIPSLDDEERTYLFSLDEDDKSYIHTLNKNIPKKVNYILQLGYYRAVNYFFKFSFQKQQKDVEFIIKQYFPSSTFPKKQLSKNHYYHNRTKIMEKYGLVNPDNNFYSLLLGEAKLLAKRHSLSKFVLKELLDICLQKNVIRPSYSTFQEIVATALKSEKKRLINKFYTDVDKSMRSQLDKLLENDDLFYSLTLMKKDQKNFSMTEIKKSVTKQQMLIDIYHKAKPILHSLSISEQNIIYYADLAEFYTIQKLKQFKSKNQARLYLLCYIYRRLLKINDHLITSLIFKMQKYTKEADDYQRNKVDIEETIDKQLRNKASALLAINIDETIPDNKVRESAFEIIPKENYQQFLNSFKKPNLSREYYRWEYNEKISLTMKRNVRPLFKVLDFTCNKQEISDAINFLKKTLSQNRTFEYQDAPLKFISKSIKKLLVKNGINKSGKKTQEINIDRYEFMVYLHLKKGLSEGTVFVKDSNSFRSLEDELIDLEYWSKNKAKILSQLNMPSLTTDINPLLDKLQLTLEKKYCQVNKNIRNNENTSIKIKFNKKGDITKWTLPYTRIDDGVNNPFYEQLPTSSIGDIIRFTADNTDFIKSFTHIQPMYSKTNPDPEVINACIVANATGTETKKMKEISDINGRELDNINKNFMRRQTLWAASELIMNRTAALPIFNEYNLTDYGVHASVDGQKFATKYNTIKSRHSKKYFGTMKGVVLYSLIANHLPLCLKVIGANEHESHFLLDIVESNTSDVEIKAISGDMHSINRVNFALLNMFGYRFMPRRLSENRKYNH